MTDRHVEKAPLERIPAEACDRTNIHMEVRARILAEACAWSFILRVRVCKESHACVFLLKVGSCTEARPWTYTREIWYNKEEQTHMMCMGGTNQNET